MYEYEYAIETNKMTEKRTTNSLEMIRKHGKMTVSPLKYLLHETNIVLGNDCLRSTEKKDALCIGESGPELL